jgi:hypothetical protein
VNTPFHLFARFGVELEYMIVGARSLDIRPLADRLLARAAGRTEALREGPDEAALSHPPGEVRRGSIAWSNELALHLVEFKSARPARALAPLAASFQKEVAQANRLLAHDGAMLLPTAMHPWMIPAREARLWPHECGDIYQAFHRIFDCRGHGWTNLQSAHLNLPFRGAAEFRRLHTAVRVVLPLLPALAASSPFVEGRRGPLLSMRLAAYRRNCARIPSITGSVVPERVRSVAEYREEILGRIYHDLAPHDPEGVLRHEWVNARGAIARFERGTIEIRVLDLQECPAADLAILQLVVAVLRRLVDETLSPFASQWAATTADLALLLARTIRSGRRARVEQRRVLRALGVPARRGSTSRASWTVSDLWTHLLEMAAPTDAPWRPWVKRILDHGSLSERILKATGAAPDMRRLRAVYRRLASCLAAGEAFLP